MKKIILILTIALILIFASTGTAFAEAHGYCQKTQGYYYGIAATIKTSGLWLTDSDPWADFHGASIIGYNDPSAGNPQPFVEFGMTRYPSRFGDQQLHKYTIQCYDGKTAIWHDLGTVNINTYYSFAIVSTGVWVSGKGYAYDCYLGAAKADTLYLPQAKIQLKCDTNKRDAGLVNSATYFNYIKIGTAWGTNHWAAWNSSIPSVGYVLGAYKYYYYSIFDYYCAYINV